MVRAEPLQVQGHPMHLEPLSALIAAKGGRQAPAIFTRRILGSLHLALLGVALGPVSSIMAGALRAPDRVLTRAPSPFLAGRSQVAMSAHPAVPSLPEIPRRYGPSPSRYKATP